MRLAAAAVLFGSMFVPAQRALRDLTPAGATSLRFAVAAVAVAIIGNARRRAGGPVVPVDRRVIVRAGLAAGGANTAGFLLQSLALQRTSASSTAFLSSLFVVFVPLCAAVVKRVRPNRWVGGAIALAVVGSYLLSGSGGVTMRSGDLFALGAALAGAVHVLIIGHYAGRLPTDTFNFAQILAVAGLAGLVAIATGAGTVTVVASLAIVYLGVTQAGGLTLQVAAQRSIDPTASAVILLLVPVVGSVVAVVVNHDPVSAPRVFGAALLVTAVLLAQQD